MPPSPVRESRPLPPLPTDMSLTWTEAVRRKKKKGGKGSVAPTASTPPKGGKGKESGGAAGKPTSGPGLPQKKRRLRSPKVAAVILTASPKGGAASITEAMAEAKRKINLADLDIAFLRPRRAVTGTLILEVPGQDSAPRADRLAVEMRSVLEGTGGPTCEWRASMSLSLRLRWSEGRRMSGGGNKDGRNPSILLRYGHHMGPVSAAKKVTDAGKILVGWSLRWKP